MPIIEYTSDDGSKQEMQVAMFDCALMVKDFDSQELTTVEELVSNADTPALATKDIINDPTNPYTGNQIQKFNDQDSEPELIYTFDYQTDKNNGKAFLPAEWFTVKNNIYEEENWRYLGHY